MWCGLIGNRTIILERIIRLLKIVDPTDLSKVTIKKLQMWTDSKYWDFFRFFMKGKSYFLLLILLCSKWKYYATLLSKYLKCQQHYFDKLPFILQTSLSHCALRKMRIKTGGDISGGGGAGIRRISTTEGFTEFGPCCLTELGRVSENVKKKWTEWVFNREAPYVKIPMQVFFFLWS